MRIVLYCALVIFVTFIFVQFFTFESSSNEYGKQCKSLAFLGAGFFNQLANGFFIFIGWRVSRSVDAINTHQRELLSDSNSSQVTNDKIIDNLNQEIEFRNKAKRNMWLTIGLICFVVTYTTLYSLVLRVGTDESCHVSDSEWVSSISTCVERHVQYVLWVYPILWLFWQAEARCHCKSRQGRSRAQTSSSTHMADSTRSPMSINSCMQEDDESDLSDGAATPNNIK